MRTRPIFLCGSGTFHFDADPDPTFNFDPDTDPDLAYHFETVPAFLGGSGSTTLVLSYPVIFTRKRRKPVFDIQCTFRSLIKTHKFNKSKTLDCLFNQDENSPKFERVGGGAADLKAQVTGTPAQPVGRAGRKFGTALQPSLLTLESPVPQVLKLVAFLFIYSSGAGSGFASK